VGPCIVCLLFFQPPSRSEGGDMTTPQQDQIRVLRKQIDALRAAEDLVSLRQLAREAKPKWLLIKSPEYHRVILELCLALNSVAPTQPEVYDSMRDLALAVIDSP